MRQPYPGNAIFSTKARAASKPATEATARLALGKSQHQSAAASNHPSASEEQPIATQPQSGRFNESPNPRSPRFRPAVLGRGHVDFIYPYCPRRITACYMRLRPTHSTAFDRSSTLLLVLTGARGVGCRESAMITEEKERYI